jgi:hypothetical protein
VGSIVVHVGLHKTGSTFLQRVLWRVVEDLNAQDVHWEPKDAFNPGTGFGVVLRRVQEGRPLDVTRVRRAAATLQEIVNTHRLLLISDETILSRRVDHSYEGNAYTIGLPVLEWLRSNVTPDVRILMYVRRQDRFLESLYTQMVHQGGSGGFDDWYARVDPARFDWYGLADRIEGIVGPGNLAVRAFETVQDGNEAFCREFFRAIDPSLQVDLPMERLERMAKRSNPGLSGRGLELARVVYPKLSEEERMVFRKVYLQRYFSNRQFDRPKLLTDDAAEHLRAIHREGNAKLFARWLPELDPAALGYV